MKLLFLIEGALDPMGASHILGRRLCEALADEGHTVTILESRTPENKPAYKPKVNIRILPFTGPDEKQLIDTVLTAKQDGKGIFSILRMVCGSSILFKIALQWIFQGRPLERMYCKELETLCIKETFDWAIAVGAPQYPAFALAKANIPCHKALFWMDPYSDGDIVGDKSRTKKELGLYEKMDVAFVTQWMYTAAKNNAFSSIREKLYPLQFPNLVKCDAVGPQKQNENNQLHCLYTGRFVPKLREPDFLLALFQQLPSNFVLQIVGGDTYDGGNAPLAAGKNQLGNRLALTGTVDPDQVPQYLAGADILIHLGNNNTSQLPSKLFEYMASGKPILHIYQQESCPSKKMLETYPMALSIPQAEITPELLDQVVQFCEKNKGKAIEYKQIYALYKEYSPNNVAKQMEETLNKYLK